MSISPYFNFSAAVRAPFGKRVGLADVTGIDYGYDNNFSLKWRNAAGTDNVIGIRLDTSDQVRVGSGTCAVKIFNRPTNDGFALQVKSEFSDTDASHACVESTLDVKSNLTTGGSGRGVQGVSRLAATYTAAGSASFIGTYGQVCNLGTFNGAGITAAGVYGLIEDGGTYTAVSHVASGWFDSHLTKTVTAGNAELLYLTNNGTTTLNSVFFIYPGNKITNLFTIDPTYTGLLTTAQNEPTWTGKTCLINVKIGATTMKLVAVDTN